jgi:hypothetical protein
LQFSKNNVLVLSLNQDYKIFDQKNKSWLPEIRDLFLNFEFFCKHQNLDYDVSFNLFSIKKKLGFKNFEK